MKNVVATYCLHCSQGADCFRDEEEKWHKNETEEEKRKLGLNNN
jgi:hypothetical protein